MKTPTGTRHSGPSCARGRRRLRRPGLERLCARPSRNRIQARCARIPSRPGSSTVSRCLRDRDGPIHPGQGLSYCCCSARIRPMLRAMFLTRQWSSPSSATCCSNASRNARSASASRPSDVSVTARLLVRFATVSVSGPRPAGPPQWPPAAWLPPPRTRSCAKQRRIVIHQADGLWMVALAGSLGNGQGLPIQLSRARSRSPRLL